MRTLIVAFVCGYLGYQIGKNVFSDDSNFLVEKKTKVSDTTDEVTYLKITSTGQISFVPEKEQGTILTKISAKNAVDFLMNVYENSSINLLSV
jgi:hypothetical protein